MLKPTDPTQAFAHLLDRLLGPAGVSRRQLCQEAGISPVFLSQIEHGKRNPSVKLMDALRKWAMLRHAGDLRKRVLADLRDDWKYIHRNSQRGRKRVVKVKVDGKKYILGGASSNKNF